MKVMRALRNGRKPSHVWVRNVNVFAEVCVKDIKMRIHDILNLLLRSSEWW